MSFDKLYRITSRMFDRIAQLQMNEADQEFFISAAEAARECRKPDIRVSRPFDKYQDIKIRFPGKPESTEVTQKLKDAGFRWNSTMGLWYAPYKDETVKELEQTAQEIATEYAQYEETRD